MADPLAEPFGLERAWLAIRSNDRAAVRAALRFDRIDDGVSFHDGLARANRVSRREAFVTDPIDDEWTLVVLPASELPELLSHARRLSSTLGEVQAFVCRPQRLGWAKLADGDAVRTFELARGKVVSDIGDRLRGEPVDADRIETHSVLEVAGAWSVDPSTLATRGVTGTGSVGGWGPAPRSRALDALGALVGLLGVGLIEVAAILAFGRLFAVIGGWMAGALVGLALLFGARLAPERSRWRAIGTLGGLALALGAVLGGAFPAGPE